MTGVPEVILEQWIGGGWVDLTSRLAAFSDWGTPMQITRGVGDAGDVTTGSFTLTLENDDGALTPGRAASSYYPNLTRFRPIRLRAYLNGAWRGRFYGFVDAEPLAWLNGPATECVVNLSCTDVFGLVAEKTLRSVAVEATAARGPLAYWPLTDSDICAEQSGNQSRVPLPPTTVGSDGEISFGGGVVLPTDSAGGVVFADGVKRDGYLRTNVGIDLPTSWSLSVFPTPATAPKDGYVVQIGTDSYSVGIWYDSSTKKFSAIETMQDSSGDPIDYVMSTSTSAWGGGMETLTVTSSTVKLGSSGTTGSRHNSDRMYDSLVSVGAGMWVESGRSSMYDGEVKHLALWSGTVPANLDTDTLTGPYVMFTMSSAVAAVMTWAGRPVTVVTQGSDQPVVMAKLEGTTALDQLSSYARGSLSRIFVDGDGNVVVSAWDYNPTPVIAPAAEIDPAVEWGADPTGDVESAVMTWPDGTTYTATSSTGAGQADLPGVLPASAGQSVSDWVAVASTSQPRFPAAPFDILTLDGVILGLIDGDISADGSIDGDTSAGGTVDGGTEHGLSVTRMVLADIGAVLDIPGLPAQLPSTTETGVVDSIIETLGIAEWTLQFTTAADLRDRLLVVGDTVRGIVGGGRLAAPLGPVVTPGSAWTAGEAITAADLNASAYQGGAMQSGGVTVTPVANTPTSLAVTFGTPFTTTPRVVATPDTSHPGDEVLGVSVSGVSTTGFTVWVYRTSTAAFPVRWAAVA